MTMVNEIFNFLNKTNKTISFAESCTGGALSSSLTMIPGASKVFLGSIVSYSTYSKQKLLNIDKSDLDKYSPVSERIAITMAENVKKQFKSDYSISVTGNAGPSTDGQKSNVGDCFIAISSENEIFCEKFNVNQSREDFIEAVKNISFQLFYDKIIIQ
jgi:nicotinamide-nucleotide amidase